MLSANYALDRTGQDQIDELEGVRNSIAIYTELIEFTKHVRDSQALVAIDPVTGKATLLPDPPPPPPPPPPAAAGAPPAPPETVSLDRQVAIYEAEKLAFETREAALVGALEACVVGDRASGTVCGLSSNEARAHSVHVRTPSTCALRPRVRTRGGRRRILGSRSTACAAAATRRSRRASETTAGFGARLPSSSDEHLPERAACGAALRAAQGFGRQSARGRHRPAHRAPRGRALLRRRGGRGRGVLGQRVAHAALGQVRPRVHGARRPTLLVRNTSHAHAHAPHARTRTPHACLLRGSEMEFARQRLTPETATDVDAIEFCRGNLTDRLQHCAIECAPPPHPPPSPLHL